MPFVLLRRALSDFCRSLSAYIFAGVEREREIAETNRRACCTMGMWINYKEQLLAFRLNKETFNEVIVPIEDIRDIEILEDNNTKTTVSWSGYSATSTEIVSDIKLRIVVGNVNTGTRALFLVFWEGKRATKSHPDYKAVAETIRSIFDEVKLMQSNQRD